MTMKAASSAALALTLLVHSSDAACPNACSGHGTCGQYDACTCYPDYGGGDCSQRFCPSNFAWITTSNGDLNADGDRDDLTVYDTDHYFKNSGISYIVSQNDPHGTWEDWPAHVNTLSKDEGHFYMECSNMGICDRSTGQCECFEGYSGAGCRRSNCPNSCSGHGVCQTVAQQKGAFTYTLWDKDMSRSCVCDGGYSGPDCSERKCGYGDDPLTTGQVYEKQWVDIYADKANAADVVDRTFGGKIRLKYTDYNGVQWTTDEISVATYDGTNGAAIKASAEAALNGLPDDVLSGVTVTAGFIEKIIPGNYKITSDAIAPATNGAASYVTASKSLRCVGFSIDNKILYDNAAALEDYSGTTAGATDQDDKICYEIGHHFGLRLEVSFAATPGDLAALEVDVSGVTNGGGFNNAQIGTDTFFGAVTQNRELVVLGTGGGTAKFTDPSTITHTCTDAGGNECGTTGNTLTVIDTATDTNIYFVGASVKVVCNSLNLGTFTIAAIPSGTTVTMTEDMPTCTLTTTQTIVLTLQDYIVDVNADYTGLLSPGDMLAIDTFKSTTPTIERVEYTASAGTGRIFLSASYAGDDASNAESITDGTGDKIAQQGDGTTEKEECSGRGLCDRETGICTCFKGYTGWACGTQNALSL